MSLRTARYRIQKGNVETILAPAGTGENLKTAAGDIVEATR
jgi:hypothetical protein